MLFEEERRIPEMGYQGPAIGERNGVEVSRKPRRTDKSERNLAWCSGGTRNPPTAVLHSVAPAPRRMRHQMGDSDGLARCRKPLRLSDRPGRKVLREASSSRDILAVGLFRRV